MKNILFLLFLLTAASACQPSVREADTREMFNAEGLRVITSFANTQQQTMSVLYGNESASAAALSGYQTHLPGEIFRLVVYKQTDNRLWYGSHINGALLSVETITSGDQLNYKLEKGHVSGDNTSASDRIAYIFSHKPSVFP
ncbi:hypothetical protein [Chitinophaga arvensicola]|uniref:Lipoprotein n=1 Tax=Chitinophaga arvensicola TaxID=29529 RepID=A0A1I0N9I8_9BACT|nr:hypothetical protein [Chitinophaga arvensicola]SEV97660.1 hypothetical protein SAMN04488122_0032 [Chitinophaga arvensicola]